MEGFDRMRLAVQAMVSDRTVRRVYSGGGTQWSRQRVAAAARTLGLPLPPERSKTLSEPSSPAPAKTSPTR